MFFQKISKEVKELGEEMIAFYEELEISSHGQGIHFVATCKFRGFLIFSTKYPSGTIFFQKFGTLNRKEKRYLKDCTSKAHLKQITFKENKTD